MENGDLTNVFLVEFNSRNDNLFEIINFISESGDFLYQEQTVSIYNDISAATRWEQDISTRKSASSKLNLSSRKNELPANIGSSSCLRSE